MLIQTFTVPNGIVSSFGIRFKISKQVHNLYNLKSMHPFRLNRSESILTLLIVKLKAYDYIK